MHAKQLQIISVTIIFFVVIWLVTGLIVELNPLLIWAVSVVLILALLIYIGLGAEDKPHWYGVLVDKDRNRISLSRLQITLWTIIIISAYMTIALIRSMPNALNHISQICAQNITEGCTPQPLNINFPNEVWIVLGISTISYAGSSLIKTNKRNQFWSNIKKEDLNKPVLYHPQEAKFSDIFSGDDEGNKKSIDLSKVQMFFFTMALIFAYMVAIGTLMMNEELLRSPIGFEFPAFSSSMTTILAISHAGYLIVKVPNQKIQGYANQKTHFTVTAPNLE